MEQHPVPQNISSYQFHLVGDMTLKQFLELAGGVVVGVLFYATGLPNIIKWPLIFISAGLGAALAFVPLEERPLEQWIFAFFRSVYSPTLFHWEKRENVKYFSDETPSTNVTGVGQAPTTPATKLSKLDEGEKSYLSRLTNLFSFGPTTTTAPAPVAPVSMPSQPVVNVAQPEPVKIERPIIPGENNGQILTAHVQGAPTFTDSASSQAGQRNVAIPQTTFISMDKSNRPQIVVEEQSQNVTGEQKTANNTAPLPIHEVMAAKETPSGTAAMFSPEAAPPSLPTITNTVSGQVMTMDKKIIEGAILEIVDEAGRVVRALKTNKAGHFLTVTGLMDGKYKILIDKEGFVFDPVEFEAKGDIIEPIAITAKQ